MGVRERDAGYELVAAGQTDQILGATGQSGDFLARIIVDVSTGIITVKDGAGTVLVIPAGVAGSSIEIGAIAVTNWNITTAAGTTCMCVGDFT